MLFDQPHFLDSVTEDQVAAMVHKLTYQIYDPLSPRERNVVHAVAIHQGRSHQRYQQWEQQQGGGVRRG